MLGFFDKICIPAILSSFCTIKAEMHGLPKKNAIFSRGWSAIFIPSHSKTGKSPHWGEATGTSGLIGGWQVFATSKSWEMLFAHKDKSSLIFLFHLPSLLFSFPLLHKTSIFYEEADNWRRWCVMQLEKTDKKCIFLAMSVLRKETFALTSKNHMS